MVMGVLATIFGPPVVAEAAAGWDRHVIAEAAGDTAQDIGLEVGRGMALYPGEGITVRPAGDGQCVVTPVGVRIDCAADVDGEQTAAGLRVTVLHSGETFTYDPALVDR